MIAASISPLYRKIALRLIPFLMLLYMVAFLDRVNISFAALTMNRDLGISDSLYGFAAGIFFLGYCLFEVPANMVLVRMGARRWISILLIVWGVTSVGTAFVMNQPQYVTVRFLLGIAESGFFPGVIFYLTLWLPRRLRAQTMGLFMLAVPLCNCIGSPISAHILLLDGAGGLKGWQWLFLLEGAPAAILGVVTLFNLADGPASARWLSEEERKELSQDLQGDEEEARPQCGSTWRHLTQTSVAYFLASVGLYGLTFWLPKILVSLGTSVTASGWWAVPPYGAGALAMVLVGQIPKQVVVAVDVSAQRERVSGACRVSGTEQFASGICPCFHRNFWRFASILGRNYRSLKWQGCRSRNRPCQLGRRNRRLYGTFTHGLASRRHAQLFRRIVGRRPEHGTCRHRSSRKPPESRSRIVVDTA